MKVRIYPYPKTDGASGIDTLIRKWIKYGPDHDIHFTDDGDYDIAAIHAGVRAKDDLGIQHVSHLHGLYWTGDHEHTHDHNLANAAIKDNILRASAVTVPSGWVAKTLQRDMHIDPYVLRHGVDVEEWLPQGDNDHDGYVLWNKNRTSDVCDPTPIGRLAQERTNVQFLTTFQPHPAPNIRQIGVKPYEKMRDIVRRAGVYLSTTKETFGIGTLEAMAAGVPVLGFAFGGNLDIVIHGETGYLAKPGDYDDLASGLDFCMYNRRMLSANAIERARIFDWPSVMDNLYLIYDNVLNNPINQNISVIIPCYNYAEYLERAVKSVLDQNVDIHEIIIVNNNSTDGTDRVGKKLDAEYKNVFYTNCNSQGVAHARNHGIELATGEYIICMDADDTIDADFARVCSSALSRNPTIGVAYTKIEVRDRDGNVLSQISEWPYEYDFDRFLEKQNQVPTCCMFRRSIWRRLGGYRQRYAPKGAGAEDAEFFMRMGAVGYGGILASEKPLFQYHAGGATSSKNYTEVDWRAGKPWAFDGRHPFASRAKSVDGVHAVRQYDNPMVSVIIPVSKNHTNLVIDAIDSVEGQSMRNWELIVVFDSNEELNRESFPFAKFLHTGGGKGAGAARNLGAKHATADLLLFLDADDWLRPTALETMVTAYLAGGENEIIYSDYAGRAYIDNAEANKLSAANRLIGMSQTGEAIIKHSAYDYDCFNAQRKPILNNRGEFYIWCLVSSLVPKKWHNEIGGFDENMESWEDWDYWIRFAKAGKCFTRIGEPLVDYRFYTGTRREDGGQLHQQLVQYMRTKYERMENVPCGGCSKNRQQPQIMQQPEAMSRSMAQPPQQPASTMVRVKLNDGNIGDHPIRGMATKEFYGYRCSGDVFMIAIADYEISRNTYILVEDEKPAEPQKLPQPQERREVVTQNKNDLTQVWGITPRRENELNEIGIVSYSDLANADADELGNIIPDKIINRVLADVQKFL